MNQKARKIISTILFISLLAQILLMPNYVYAQQVIAVPPGTAVVVANGERFMNAAPLAVDGALKLAQKLEAINQTNLEDVPAAALVEARQLALQTAQQTAVAQGSLGGILYGLEQLEASARDATDIDQVFTDVQTNGFSAELETAFIEAGLTITAVAALESRAVDNFDTRRDVGVNGFDAETETYLQGLGLPETTITEVEDAYATYGVADNTAPDKIAQLRGSAAELKLARNSALVTYIQLLSQQVYQAQLNGETGRAITTADIDVLVEDQLRLLTHIAYLNELWGGDTAPNVGEGQWLFVERYSWRVVERLDALILETHNLGLTVDLLIALQIHATALAAQSGGPVQAMAELDDLSQIQATLVGDNLPGGQAALQSNPSLLWRVAVNLYDTTGNDALLNWVSREELTVAETAVTTGKDEVYGRMARLAKPPQLPALSGSIDESDETNNTDLALFYTKPSLPPDILSFIEEFIPGFSGILDFVWGVLTGQSDNPLAIGINIVLSFSPVLGIVLDAIALVTAQSEWERAFAFIGMLVSILSDGAEILAALSAAVPPALAATVPGAILMETLDVGSAVLKGIRAFVGTQLWNAIKLLRFDKALKLGGETLFRLARFAHSNVSQWPHTIEGVLNLITTTANTVSRAFGSILHRFGGNMDEFTDGAFLAGRALNAAEEAGGTLSNDAVLALQRYGDEVLGESVDELSDDGVNGLGKLFNELGESNTRRFLAAFPCPIASLQKDRLGRAAALDDNPISCALEFLGRVGANLTQEQINGLVKLINGLGEPETAAELLTRFPSSTQDSLLNILGLSSRQWTAESLNGLARMTEDIGIAGIESLANQFTDEIFEATFQVIRLAPIATGTWSFAGVEGVAKMIGRFDQQLAEDVLRRQGRGEWGNQVFSWLNELNDSPAFNGNNVRGWVEGLAVQDRSNYIGRVFELKVGAEQLVDRGIKEINHYPDGRQGVDFILNDNTIVEIKNVNEIDQRAFTQLRSFLGIKMENGIPIIDPNGPRYGDRRMEYVFRSARDETIENDLITIAQEANFLGLLSDDNLQYFEQNIRWLDLDVFPPPAPGGS